LTQFERKGGVWCAQAHEARQIATLVSRDDGIGIGSTKRRTSNRNCQELAANEDASAGPFPQGSHHGDRTLNKSPLVQLLQKRRAKKDILTMTLWRPLELVRTTLL
jgi:hypothetical protein